jgi:hypothetical protein
LARERFDPNLTEAELKVLHDSASSEELPEPGENTPKHEIPAKFIRWLATEPEATPHINPKGLRVYAATIPDKLDLEECRIGFTLDFRRCDFQDKINLHYTETREILILDSLLAKGICADGVTVHGPLFLRRIQSQGEIRLLGALIDSVLDCSGTKLVAKGNALSADRATIGGGVFLIADKESGESFESEGTIRLLNAQIDGDLSCRGAKLRVKEGNALVADGAEIGGSIFLNEDFESSGTIRLPGAKIKGDLECPGAKLNVADGDALSADGAEIGGNVSLYKGFESRGTICLQSAQIGGDLAFLGAKVTAVFCTNMRVTGDLILQPARNSKETRLYLNGAKVKSLHDDQDSWPSEGNLDLNGLVYEELALHDPPLPKDFESGGLGKERQLKAKERIAWIMLQPPDRRTEPQPWMQLRDLLERKGDHKGAKNVLYRLRRLKAGSREWHPWQWMRETLSRFVRILALLVSPRKLWPYLRHPNRVFATLFAWLEEAPLRILYSIALFLILGCLIFSHAGASGALAPTEAEAYKAFTAGKPMPAAYPKLYPLVYTLENAVPLVRLGQDEKWAPDQQYPGTTWFTNYWFLMWARWLLILSGWFQATVLAAALSGRFKQ